MGVGLWVLGGLRPSRCLLLHPLGPGWVGDGQEPLHLLVGAPPGATRACTLPPSAPPALHHLESLPPHLRALTMGCWWTKPPSSAELPSPKGQGDKNM